MKEVIIKEQNAEKIMEAFQKVQGKAKVRTVDSIRDLYRICDAVEKRLYPMTAKALEGTKVHYSFRQHFPKAYKYSPDSTHFDLVFTKGSWRVDVDSIRRDTCPNMDSIHEYSLELSDSAKEKVLERFI